MWVIVLVGGGLAWGSGFGSRVTANTASSIILELPQAVHFLAPGGEDVVVGPGTYEVEAVENG